jgi:hypothetical protein
LRADTASGTFAFVKSVVYLATRAPSKFTVELGRAGYRVLEALAVSEALYLCETENVDAIVIAPDVEDSDVVEAQMRRITIKLKPEATAKDVIWELSQLFPQRPDVVQ